MNNSHIEVPGPDANWWTEINAFALTYSAYSRGGDFDSVVRIGQEVRQNWDRDTTLPNNVEICRTALFFEQRRFRHLDAEPVGDDDRYVRSIVNQIRDLSGGRVPGPADPAP
jgi:hypothetical protein